MCGSRQTASCRARAPDVKASNGQLSVKLTVQEGADFRGLLSQLLVLLGDQGSLASVQEGKAELQVLVASLSKQVCKEKHCMLG